MGVEEFMSNELMLQSEKRQLTRQIEDLSSELTKLTEKESRLHTAKHNLDIAIGEMEENLRAVSSYRMHDYEWWGKRCSHTSDNYYDDFFSGLNTYKCQCEVERQEINSEQAKTASQIKSVNSELSSCNQQLSEVNEEIKDLEKV